MIKRTKVVKKTDLQNMLRVETRISVVFIICSQKTVATIYVFDSCRLYPMFFVFVIVWQFDLQLSVQSLPITTNDVSSMWGSCYSIFSFMCMFYRSLFVLLYFFFWPLCCLFFFDLRILITPLVSSKSSSNQSITDLFNHSNYRSNSCDISLNYLI